MMITSDQSNWIADKYVFVYSFEYFDKPFLKKRKQKIRLARVPFMWTVHYTQCGSEKGCVLSVSVFGIII